NPGTLRTDNTTSGTTFGATASGATKSGPNYTVRVGDFPFHQFNNPDAKSSGVKFTTDDTMSSQGTFGGTFTSVTTGVFTDTCQRNPDPIFNVVGVGTRKVEPRNTPTMINAVFNFRNFWDGRANNVFNGMNPFGPTDPTARVLRVTNGVPAPVQIALPNASLASQEVGPPNNGVEMSCAGRSFPQLGRKLLALRPLGQQLVDPTDSELGSLSRFPSLGLNTTYAALIRAAFDPAWWNSSAVVNGFTVMENNFSLYWGLSVMLYGSTQVSDQ